jgi:hypothetical protein
MIPPMTAPPMDNTTLASRIGDPTDRQGRLLRLLGADRTALELAGRLGLTPQQARRETAALLRTIGVGRTDEAVLLWWGSRAGARADLCVAAQMLVAASAAPVPLAAWRAGARPGAATPLPERPPPVTAAAHRMTLHGRAR